MKNKRIIHLYNLLTSIEIRQNTFASIEGICLLFKEQKSENKIYIQVHSYLRIFKNFFL
jgi:hypothetical protein